MIKHPAGKKDIFPELAFCLFTPQSKAKSCWKAIETLLEKQLIYKGSHKEISNILSKIGVRFKNNKAKYLIEARRLASNPDLKDRINSFKNPVEAREWLVKNVKGMAYKEASHFLRNIGYGQDIAILDRHILKNLKLLGVIKEVPRSITPKTYLEIEQKMKVFAKQVKIPMDHLDITFWCNETGEIFK